MRYAGFMPNDFINGEGVCVSLWTQGCPHRCVNCHNPETWDFEGGFLVPNDLKDRIIKAISANNIQRNFSILGGEPLCPENKNFVLDIITAVRIAYPNIKIFLWTGYTILELRSMEDSVIDNILEKCDCVIDGRYNDSQRDITLELRGSKNQRVLKQGLDF